jgi:glycosyltransferase involved in cell wall biosynthesis
MEYIIITPAKNEEKFIEQTLQSVLRQTIKPKKWVIVDDGSTDNTAAIVKRYLAKCNYLHLINHNSARDERSGGSKVVRAFNIGYDTIRDDYFDFIVKLDADLTLPSNYFENVIKCFVMYPKVGLCGGYCTVEKNGKYIMESYSSEDHVRGAFKAYRRKCFEDIGGIKQIWSWDGIDEAAIAFHRWELKVLPLAVIHHRPTTGEYNLLIHSYKTGREMYKERIDFFSLIIISSVYLFRKPAIVGSILYILGYFVSWINNDGKVIDKDLGDYIKRHRYNRVLNKFRSFVRIFS